MVWSRTAAVNYLKQNTLCNGLVLEFLDWTTGIGRFAEEGFQRVYVMNQMGLTGTALKQVGDPLWMKIRDVIAQYRAAYGYSATSSLRNYFYPILDPAVISVTRAFKAATETILYDSNPNQGSETNPRQIILHTEPTDPLSDTCGDIRLNRALMRALYHWQQGQTSTANTCYDFVIANRRPEGWWLADDPIDFDDGGVFNDVWKYSVYKQMIQWIVAKDMGRSRLYTNVLDVMQDPVHGGVRTFTKTNHSFIHDKHNTETTALAVIADIRWNPP